MDVVLFGATGNIGRAIAGELVARGHHVTGVTRSGAVRGEPVAGVELRAGDATDPAGVAEAVRDRDAASRPSARPSVPTRWRRSWPRRTASWRACAGAE